MNDDQKPGKGMGIYNIYTAADTEHECYINYSRKLHDWRL